MAFYVCFVDTDGNVNVKSSVKESYSAAVEALHLIASDYAKNESEKNTNDFIQEEGTNQSPKWEYYCEKVKEKTNRLSLHRKKNVVTSGWIMSSVQTRTEYLGYYTIAEMCYDIPLPPVMSPVPQKIVTKVADEHKVSWVDEIKKVLDERRERIDPDELIEKINKIDK